MHHLFKKILNENLKSSPKFGRSDEGSNKLGEILRERRFLYFTKNGPIEIVFNIKHYLSAFILSMVFLFKIVQFLFIGATTFFNYLTFKNNQVINQKFTESEIETLKNIANDVLNLEKIKTKESFINEDISLESVSQNGKNSAEARIDVKEKLNNIKSLVSDFGKSFTTDIVKSDEVLFEEFSDLANPEMIAFELNNSFNTKKELNPKIKKESFSYKDLPVIPFIAPRTKKLKIINFTKKLDLEISQLVNVFKSLNLSPDNINLKEIEDYLKKIDLRADNEELIKDTSLRFQFLEELKNAIIFLPLKPPMQYYYVSSPYGFRIHPKSKLRQMHNGIDMAGTWQEEVRAPADGYVSFSGRNGSFGKSIKIVHKHGVTTLYGHLHRLKVRKGDFVTEGDIIGKMGSTGRAVGAHLHYEIKVKKKSVNPYNFISIGRELLSSSIIRK
jgi:murein DD-endopeptidase MepM/ murein hydrolase activator NlpD